MQAEATMTHKLPDMPALDGLRALSVIAVLLYHAGAGWLTGGFLGVEVFFVISGYLITALLLAEYTASGSIDLKRFWLGRARRLLPAVFVMLIATAAYAVAFLPDEVAGLRADIAAALGYVTNWYLVFGEQSYFEAMGRPSLLKHLWSLAIEEQFYLLWPLALLAGFSVWGAVRHRYKLLLTIAAAIAASSALMFFLYEPGQDPSRLYYGTDTRAAALLIGAALAFVCHPYRLHKDVSNRFRQTVAPGRRGMRTMFARARCEVLRVGALTALVVVVLTATEQGAFLYRGGFALTSVLTAVLIASLVIPREGPLKSLLACAPVRWVGLRSYGIYLWHWPVFMVSRPGIDMSLTGASAFALRLGVTLVAADLCYRLIETPIRRGALGRAWRRMREASGRRRTVLQASFSAGFASLVVVCSVLGVQMASAKEPERPEYLTQNSVQTAGSLESTANEGSPAAGSSATGGASQPASTRFPAANGNIESVTAVGDSVFVGASGGLEKSFAGAGIELGADASVGMQANTAIGKLEGLSRRGKLGDAVVVHIGNNGPITGAQFDKIMEASSGSQKVVIVTDRVPRSWEEPNNRVLKAGAEEHPKAVLADWHATSDSERGYFYDDGIHLTPEGQQAYSRLITSKITSS